ncbi:golgin subfamily B member 1-like isoform X5 [Asterias rubens]|uniref:golgin subfamily B member 1-like isoform X5 n=1 Tax=Asterias rubens TaxID=7604 RepID=UPI0014551208|nr:golgin subfamily B member 1-like isoform X5 [Asterias rubens]
MDNKSDVVPIERTSTKWGSVTMMDRGDAPAQVVIEKTLKAQSERRTEETKEQLVKITDRVEQAMAAFELDEKLMNDNKAAFFVPDLIELEKIIKDTILKRKYQQEVTIFIVGYETKNGQRLKLLSQINDFFSTYINSIDEEEITPKPAVENEMEEISTRVQEAMDTASSAAQRLNDIGTDLFNFVEKLHGGKAASKSKKKLEKALMQAKDDIMNLTEKLMGAQTEIEEKEDQMTKLYKQIDVKNLEVMKYKNNAETAKKNLGQVEDLKLQIQEKQEEIDKLHRSMADRDLSMQQMEQSRETTLVKLRAAGGENEKRQHTIDKLQSKVSTLQVQLEESRNDLQRHHESTIVSLKHQHNGQIEAVKAEYQQKIDKLEEELANKVKHWAPESDDESEKPSFSRRSSQLDLASRKSNRLKDDKSVPPSRQSSNIHKKVDSLSRQSSITTPAQETSKPTPTPDTPKSQKSDTSKGSKPNTPKATDSTDSAAKVATPKKAGRNKSNLEPVHEVPFEEKIPIEDEGRWEKVPQEKLPSAFKQYRKEALFIVQGLQNEVKVVKEDNHKKVTLLRTQVKEKEDQFEMEKNLLVQKVSIVEKQKIAAEKEADEAMAQLENFVKEQGQMAKISEEESKEKKLKKLTPEQRLKYFGPEKSNLSVDTKEPVTDNKEAAQNGKATTGLSNQEQLVTDGEEPNGEPPPAQAPPTEGAPPIIEEELPTIEATDHEMQTTPVVQVGRSQQTSRRETRGSDEGEEDEGRPQSSTSQRSLYEKYRAQLEQKKAEIVERRSRATSMHGSLLSAKSERLGSRPRSNLTTSSGDIPFPDEVDKMDMATSPVAFSVSSRSSKQSVDSVADHPITQDYLKAYQIIMDFKDSLIKVLTDKDLLAAADRLSDIGQLTFDRDLNVQNQVFEMTTSIHSFLKEAASIINSYLYNDQEPAVSSLITQGDASKAMSFQKENTDEKLSMEREMTNTLTAETDPEVREIRENYENMKSNLDQQKKDYEDKLNNNAIMMMELQDTIQELQHELSAFGSPTKPYSAMSGFSSRFDPKTEPMITFSRMDSERNQKALKRAVNAQRLEPEYYNEVVQAMDQYTVLPAKRLVHLAKKYAHHTHMKHIEENVRQSNSLDEEVYTLLERMEALQSLRAQRWGEQMDALSSERLHLAHMLMEALQRVEEESGIFMIKPILSWRGRNQIPLYQQSRISESYRPHKTFLKPIPPMRDGTPLNMVPAPTPASQHPIKSAATRPRTQEPPVETTPAPVDESNDVPVKGSSIQLVGPQSQPMWAMSNSFTRPGADGDTAKDRFAKITTPRILELDVNRMLIGQNTVSALTKPFISNDRLVNASNASVRSYMSIDRPSANPAQNRGRPNSTGTEGARQSPSVLAVKTPNSAGSRHSRTRSEGALSLSQPLPPIKVPLNNDLEGSRPGTTGSVGSSIHRRDLSRPVTHPSPPRTPPGSSIRQSPPFMNAVDLDEKQDEDDDAGSTGHVTKISMRSASQSTERSFTPDRET